MSTKDIYQITENICLTKNYYSPSGNVFFGIQQKHVGTVSLTPEEAQLIAIKLLKIC